LSFIELFRFQGSFATTCPVLTLRHQPLPDALVTTGNSLRSVSYGFPIPRDFLQIAVMAKDCESWVCLSVGCGRTVLLFSWSCSDLSNCSYNDPCVLASVLENHAGRELGCEPCLVRWTLLHLAYSGFYE
jgi:hypothetical protein